MDRGAWWATVPRVVKSRTLLSDYTNTNALNIHFREEVLTVSLAVFL